MSGKRNKKRPAPTDRKANQKDKITSVISGERKKPTVKWRFVLTEQKVRDKWTPVMTDTASKAIRLSNEKGQSCPRPYD